MKTNLSLHPQSTGRIGAWRSRALGIAGRTSAVIAALVLAANVAWSATRYEAEAAGNTRVNCGVQGDGAASGGQRMAKSDWGQYGGIAFNSINVPAAGPYDVTLCYFDPWDSGRNSYVSVNGVPDPLVGPHEALWCPAGNYVKVTTTVALAAGDNAITIYAPPNEWGPHWDYIEISQPGYIISATADAGGSISPNGSVHVEPGASQMFTITPEPFYGIADVRVDGASAPAAITTGSYTFDNVTSEHTISATFQLLPEQEVSGRVTDGTNGIADANVYFKTSPLASVSAYGTATTDADGNFTRLLPPADWYVCASADGYDLSPDTTFTVTDSPVTDINVVLVQDPEWDVLFIATVDQFSTTPADDPIPNWALNHPAGYNLVTPANQSKGVPTIATVDGVNWIHFDRGLLIGAQDQNAYNFCDGYKLTGLPEDPSLANGVPASGVSIVAVVQPILKADSNINFLWGSSPEHDIVGLYFDGLVLGVNTETGEVVVRRKSGVQSTGIILADGQKAILSLVVQLDGSCRLYKDGAEVWTGAAFGSNPFAILTGSFHQIGVGCDAQDAPTSFNGNIGDVFVYKTALTAVKRGTLEADLGAKFGVTLSSGNHTIMASAGPGGSINPSGVVSVTDGGSQAFTITANSGYVLDQVLVDGINDPAAVLAGGHTFTGVTGDHTIAASFLTTFATWAMSKGLDGTPGKENGVGDDPDKDGRTNLQEFAFNGDPLSATSTGQSYVLTSDSSAYPDAAKELVVTLAVRKGAVFTGGTPATSAPVEGIAYAIEGGTNLAGFGTKVWPVTTINPGVALTDNVNYEYRSFALDGSNGLSGKGFIRAKVTTSP